MNTISNNSIVETTEIGHDVIIEEFSVIRKNVIIGNNVHIYPHVIISSGVTIGDGTRIYPGSFIGKVPDGAGALARTPTFNPFTLIGKNCAIGPNAIIYYGVTIGDNTLVGDSASIREGSEIGNSCVVGRHVTINYNVKIGGHTKIMDHSWLAGNMQVGENVFISGGVLTSNDNSMGHGEFEEDRIKGPIIENEVKIGIGAKLLPNIRIGRGAIIGAGAVVTKDVPSKTLVMGIPAKIIKKVGD